MPQLVMQWITQLIIACAAVTLLATGTYLCLIDKPASATAALGIGFLLVALLLLAKFKRFRGFGFEAEMWEDKQTEAAALVDRLTALSEAVSEQMVLIASKLGLWGGSLSNVELMDLADKLSGLAKAAGVPSSRLTEILTPAYNRVEFNYWSTAHRSIEDAFRQEQAVIRVLHSAPNIEERDKAVERTKVLNEDQNKFTEYNYQRFASTANLAPLLDFAKQCPSLAHMEALHRDLKELNLDLRHFHTTHSLRRQIDISASPPRFLTAG